MWELDYKESWAPTNWCFWTVVLEKILESPLDCKEIQQANPKGNQPWVFTGRTDAEGEAPILWPPDSKKWLIWKDPDAWKYWRWEEKGTTENEMVGWHHWLNGWVWVNFRVSNGQEAWSAAVHGVTKSQTWLSDWTELKEVWILFLTYGANMAKWKLLSRVQLFPTPWTIARQPSLSITNSQSPPKPMSIELVIPSNHFILCYPLLLLPSIFPTIRVFSNELALRIRWLKYWSFSFSISPSNEYSRFISFRMDWLDLLAVQGTLKSSPTPQLESINSSVLSLSGPTLTSVHD